MTEEETDTNEIEVEPVHDPEGYVQERRLKDVFDAREKVRERRIKAKELQLENQHRNSDSLDAVRLYRTAVENYLTELKPLIFEEERGRNIWFNKEIGTLTVPLPVQKKQPGKRATVYKYNDKKLSKLPEPKEIELTGLGCLFKLSEPLTVNFDVTLKYGRNRTQRDVITHTTAIPFDQLDRIMNTANQYLSERGLELDPEEDTDPASI